MITEKQWNFDKYLIADELLEPYCPKCHRPGPASYKSTSRYFGVNWITTCCSMAMKRLPPPTPTHQD